MVDVMKTLQDNHDSHLWLAKVAYGKQSVEIQMGLQAQDCGTFLTSKVEGKIGCEKIQLM